MSKKTIQRVTRYLQGHSINVEGVMIPYELHGDFKPCIEREV